MRLTEHNVLEIVGLDTFYVHFTGLSMDHRVQSLYGPVWRICNMFHGKKFARRKTTPANLGVKSLKPYIMH